GWAQIDVQLKQRHNLIPNLVETVKGYAAHEKDTLEAVISARQQAVQAPSDAAQAGTAIGAENILTQAVGKLFALAEAYPDLKADSSFMNLQEELSTIENKIAFARQHYNDAATKYNVYIVTFPPMLVANLLGFKGRDLFTVADAAVREAPKVSF
ncbi:MAG: LemA family protein, partial [Planctomycetota bacterium]